MITDVSDRHHGDLLAIDPSVRSVGVALFRHGVLVASGHLRMPAEWMELPPAARCLRVAQEILAWYGEQEGASTIRTVVFEWPQIYIDAKSKGDQNGLLGLVGVGQSVAALVTMRNIMLDVRPPELVSPTPAEWTGQLPKTVGGKKPKSAFDTPRGSRIRTNLQRGELAVVDDQHDAIDGLGLGLFALNRYTHKRVFSGAV